MKDAGINVSGIRVGVRPRSFDDVRAAIARLPGLEIAAEDRRAGRLGVVQDRPTLEEHEDGLRAVQAIPGVLYAELVCHVQDREED